MAKKNVTIYQHRDINGNPVANLTPENAVYDKDGKRLDYKLAGMDIDKIKEAQDEALESIAAAEESMTKNIGLDTYPVFSDTKPYVKGEIVNYGGLLYEFTADHEAGAWIGTDARETSLRGEVKDDIDKSGNLIYGNFFTIPRSVISKDDGRVIEQSDISDYVVTPFIILNRDEDLVVSGYISTGNAALLAWYDSDKKFISSIFEGLASGYYKDYIIKKSDYPDNAMFIRCTGRSTFDCYVRNLTIKYLMDITEGNTWIDLGRLYPNMLFNSKKHARDSVPGYMRVPNLTIKYSLMRFDNIIEEISISSDEWSEDVNWKSLIINDIFEGSYIYAITDKDNNILFFISRGSPQRESWAVPVPPSNEAAFQMER